MRLLTAISLALVVLIALACTATPATPAPTPAKPTSSGAFSCMELADKLAAAQTETAAAVLTRSWNESGCAQKAAGVTKVPTASPTMTQAQLSKFLGITPTPDIWVNARLKGRWKDLLASYAQTPEGKQHWECLVYAYTNHAGANETKTLYFHSTSLFARDYWSVEVTGPSCKGIQTWYIDDDTGKVTYQGSSLDK